MKRRTDTIKFMGSRPNADQIAKAAAEYLSADTWEVTQIGALTVGRTRRGSTYFAVRVSYKRINSN